MQMYNTRWRHKNISNNMTNAKLCPGCGIEFTKKEYMKREWVSEDNWNKKIYCCEECRDRTYYKGRKKC